MKKYIDKISKRELSSQDVGSIINSIEEIIKDKKKGYEELSTDDIKQLRITEFLLKKYEENKEDLGFTCNNEGLAYHKVRDLINDLELNRIVTYVVQSMGGHFSFKITNRIMFRNYLYKIIEEILDKIPKEIPVYVRIKKIDWKNPWIVTIVGGLIVVLLGAILINIFTDEEPPRIGFDDISFTPNYFWCGDNQDKFDMKFTVAHISGKEVGFGQPYYLFINQTKNDCLRGFTFFNDTQNVAQLLCYNTFSKGNEEVEACSPKFDPINKDTVVVESHQDQLVTRMKEIFKEHNISSCEIAEEVKLCVYLDGKGYCSAPKEAKIQYSC